MLPGVLIPAEWTLVHVVPPAYSLRMDHENAYVIYGSEDVIAVFPFAQYPGSSRKLVVAILGVILGHINGRERREGAEPWKATD